MISLNNLSNLWRKLLILGKITIAFRNNLVVNFEKKKVKFVLEVLLFRYVCFTGIDENLAETPIFKESLIFAENGHYH